MWNFKFHGALSLRLVASNSPLPQRPQGRACVLLGPSRHWSCLPRRPFFVTRPRPLTKIKEPRCTVGYSLTGEPCRLAYPPHSAPVLPGLFHASSSNAKRETAASGLATAPDGLPVALRQLRLTAAPKGSTAADHGHPLFARHARQVMDRGLVDCSARHRAADHPSSDPCVALPALMR